MRDLMLKLLTYEPFEEITGEEEKFIDTVLKNTVTVYITMLYYDLMHAFMNYIANPQGNQALALWYTTYFTINTNAAQSYLCYAQNGKRAYYPTLFKKICFYCTTELGLKDGEFFGQIGIRENLMYKWEISSRYRRILNSDSYKRIRVFRNGRKVEYLTKVVKAAYYEASRQEAGVTYFDPGQKGHNSPRKWQLMPFVECFAGTGTVGASVGAYKLVENDIDVGAVCFMYCMSHNVNRVKTRLAHLHNKFVFRNYLKPEHRTYTKEYWKAHRDKYSKYQIKDSKYDEFMMRIRNNYEYIHTCYMDAIHGYSVNFNNPSEDDIKTFYNIGVAWYFLHSIKANNPGNEFSISSIDASKYYSYMRNGLCVEGLPKKASEYQKYKLICRKLRKDEIKFVDGKEYMDAFRGATILNEDFRYILNNYTECFHYLDSPYFLTTDYNVPFQDEEHKAMLDILRNADFKWLFSMQYKELCEDGNGGGYGEKMRNNSKRLRYQKQGNPIIHTYKDYYAGFVDRFHVNEIDGKLFYEADSSKVKKSNLFVLLFPNSTTREMMICNFDVRRVFPYEVFKKAEVVVVPFLKFLEFANQSTEKRDFPEYIDIIDRAIKYREVDIIKNYSLGGFV